MSPSAELAAWARKVRYATERRNAAIVKMSAEGASLRAVAEVAGLSHSAIVKILARQADVSTNPPRNDNFPHA